MADLINMLPTLDDALLANLLANARRLSGVGNDKQRASASAMLTAVEAECAKRAEAALANKPKRKAPPRRAPAAPALPT
jgi:hypothetical protein